MSTPSAQIDPGPLGLWRASQQSFWWTSNKRNTVRPGSKARGRGRQAAPQCWEQVLCIYTEVMRSVPGRCLSPHLVAKLKVHGLLFGISELKGDIGLEAPGGDPHSCLHDGTAGPPLLPIPTLSHYSPPTASDE